MTLPDADCEPVPGPLPGSPGYAAKWQTGMADDVTRPQLGWGLLGSAAIAVLGWLGPWVYVDSLHLRLGGPHLLTLPLTTAVILAAAGLLILQRRGHRWVSVTALAFSVVLFVVMTVSVGSVCEDEAGKLMLPINAVSAGWGLWVTTLGALCGLVAAVRALVRRDTRPANRFRHQIARRR